MGPRVRYLGPEVPAEELIWQDPSLPWTTIDRCAGHRRAQGKAAGFRLSVSELVSTAWRRRRPSVLRQTRWRERRPDSPARRRTGSQPAGQLAKVLKTPRGIATDSTKLSLGQEDLARRSDRARGLRRRRAGGKQRRPQGDRAVHARTHGRLARADDVKSFAVLEPIADGFRNYLTGKYACPPRSCSSTRHSC